MRLTPFTITPPPPNSPWCATSTFTTATPDSTSGDDAQGLDITLERARRLVRVVYEVMALVTCAGMRVAGVWLRQAVCGR